MHDRYEGMHIGRVSEVPAKLSRFPFKVQEDSHEIEL